MPTITSRSSACDRLGSRLSRRIQLTAELAELAETRWFCVFCVLRGELCNVVFRTDEESWVEPFNPAGMCIEADALTGPEPPRRVFHVGDRRQAELAGDRRGVRQHAADFDDHARGQREERRP